MSTALAQQQNNPLGTLDAETMQMLVSGGDCSRLSSAQKTAYYAARCEAAGLDPRAQPFAFMRLNGKEVLYALKGCSDQLAAKHGIRLTIVSQSTDDGIRVVTVHAVAKDGRETDEIGAVPVKGIQGDALANAMMKAVTKAKRRAVLSICGLGMLDETEIETISSAAPIQGIPASLAAAAETLGAKVVEVKQISKSGKAKVADLWDEAGREWGEKDREGHWRTARTKVFGAQAAPRVEEWTDEQIAAMDAALFPDVKPEE